jgi:lipopolysaccharide export system protein LptC
MTWRSLLFLLTLTVATALLWWNLRPPAPIEPVLERPDQPDFWMRAATTERFGEDGARQFLLQAERLEHYPDDGRIELQEPRLEYFAPRALRWDMRAQHGLISGNRSRVDLDEAVRVHRRPASGAVQIMDTDWLRLFPDEHFATTDAPVRVTEPAGHISGIGMRIMMLEDRFTLERDVRGRYAAP